MPVLGSLSATQAVVLGTTEQVERGWARARECGSALAYDVRSLNQDVLTTDALERMFSTIVGRPVTRLSDGTLRCLVDSAQQRDAIERSVSTWLAAHKWTNDVEVTILPQFASALMTRDVTRSGDAGQVAGGWFALPAGDYRVSVEHGADGRVLRAVLERV